MNPNDPAFARTYSDRERQERGMDGQGYGHGHGGMPIRAYFAAHAPAVPAAWFRPVLPPEPSAPVVPEFPMTKAGQKQAEKFEQEVAAPYRLTRQAWLDECGRQTAAQWPWAWADSVLGAQ